MQLVQEIEERIKRNKEAKIMLQKEFLEGCAPQGYKKGTSYLDADTIHGSRKEYNLFDMIERLRLLDHMIYIDEIILGNYNQKERIQNKLHELKNIEDKVTYLRMVEGKTQEETAEILNYSTRGIQEIEKRMKKNV